MKNLWFTVILTVIKKKVLPWTAFWAVLVMVTNVALAGAARQGDPSLYDPTITPLHDRDTNTNTITGMNVNTNVNPPGAPPSSVQKALDQVIRPLSPEEIAEKERQLGRPLESFERQDPVSALTAKYRDSQWADIINQNKQLARLQKNTADSKRDGWLHFWWLVIVTIILALFAAWVIARREEIATAFNNLSERVRGLSDRIKEVAQKTDETSQRVNEVDGRIETLETKPASATGQQWQDVVSGHREEISADRRQINRLEQRIADLVTKQSDSQRVIERLCRRVGTLENEQIASDLLLDRPFSEPATGRQLIVTLDALAQRGLLDKVATSFGKDGVTVSSNPSDFQESGPDLEIIIDDSAPVEVSTAPAATDDGVAPSTEPAESHTS